MRRACQAVLVGGLELIVSLPAQAAITYSDLYTLGTPSGFTAASVTTAYPSSYNGRVVGSGTTAGGNTHAVLWNSSVTSGLDLTPSGFTTSVANGSFGVLQFGSGSGTATGGATHALQWSNSAGSLVDLNPAGITTSQAFGANSGGQVVGSGSGTATGGATHALLFSGGGAIDLHPASGYASSAAYGTFAARQVGQAVPTSGSATHAMVWITSAASAIDLHPSGLTSSVAYGYANGVEVGSGSGALTGDAVHALLWKDTAASSIDLNPDGFTQSAALGVGTPAGLASLQFGYGSGPVTGGNAHALLWDGAADRYVDLHSSLPANFVSSYAMTTPNVGNLIFGIATDASGATHAIAWTVPEPTSLAMLPVAGILLARRRRSE